jgi:hypothetical protein
MAQYTASDAQNKMNTLITGLEKKYKELGKYINRPELTPSQEADINNQMVKLVIEIHHRKQMAAFDAAAATVIRPPTAAEVTSFQKTLTDLGKDINSIATFQAVVKFAENVMTQNAQRFTDIMKTIKT